MHKKIIQFSMFSFRYERGLMDDDEYDDMSEGDRAAAEAELRRRDREEGNHFRQI